MINENDKDKSYLEGKTLEDYVKDKMQLTTEEIYSIAANLCNAVQEFNGFYLNNGYRELKPSNIIITSSRKVTLLRYDINNVHKVYDNKGTISMTSSINYNKHNIAKFTKQNYILNIGTIIYYMATGRGPLTILQPLMEDSYDENVDENIKRIIKKCFQSDSANGYISVEELKREIVIGLLSISKYKNHMELRDIHSNPSCRKIKRLKKVNAPTYKKVAIMLPKVAAAVMGFFYSLLFDREILKNIF